jgi:hypothetical protein
MPLILSKEIKNGRKEFVMTRMLIFYDNPPDPKIFPKLLPS